MGRPDGCPKGVDVKLKNQRFDQILLDKEDKIFTNNPFL